MISSLGNSSVISSSGGANKVSGIIFFEDSSPGTTSLSSGIISLASPTNSSDWSFDDSVLIIYDLK